MPFSWLDLFHPLISFAGVALSALISYRVAKYTTDKEFDRLKQSWKREDVAAFELMFSEMVSAVTEYTIHWHADKYAVAVGKIAAVRCQSSGLFARKLDNLQKELRSCAGDADRIRVLLDDLCERVNEEIESKQQSA